MKKLLIFLFFAVSAQAQQISNPGSSLSVAAPFKRIGIGTVPDPAILLDSYKLVTASPGGSGLINAREQAQVTATGGSLSDIYVGHTDYLDMGTGGAAVVGFGTVVNNVLTIEGVGNAAGQYANQGNALFMDIGTGFTQTTGPGWAWQFDNQVFGPVGVQPKLLDGGSILMENYYNGQPANSVSGALWAVNLGPVLAAGNRVGKSTYPVGVGFGCVGYSVLSDTSTHNGFNTCVQIGGSGSGWMADASMLSSKIGTGIDIRDTNVYGAYIHGIASGQGLIVASDGGNVGVGMTAPAAKIQIDGGTSADQLRLGNDAGAEYWSLGRDTSDGTLAISNNQSTNVKLVGVGMIAPTVIITPLTTPSHTATCTAGQFYVDTGFIYVCTASGTVKRTALSTF